MRTKGFDSSVGCLLRHAETSPFQTVAIPAGQMGLKLRLHYYIGPYTLLKIDCPPVFHCIFVK